MPRTARLALLLMVASPFLFAKPPYDTKRPEQLLVGIAAVDLQLPNGVPLAGYGSGARRIVPLVHGYPYATYFKPAHGNLDPIRVKAMVLQREHGQLLFMSFDLAAVTNEMYEGLVERLRPLGFHRDDIFISATHTHSGPGTLSDRWL